MANIAILPDMTEGEWIISSQSPFVNYNSQGEVGDYIFDFKEEAEDCLKYLKASSNHNSKGDDGLDLIVRGVAKS